MFPSFLHSVHQQENTPTAYSVGVSVIALSQWPVEVEIREAIESERKKKQHWLVTEMVAMKQLAEFSHIFMHIQIQ